MLNPSPIYLIPNKREQQSEEIKNASIAYWRMVERLRLKGKLDETRWRYRIGDWEEDAEMLLLKQKQSDLYKAVFGSVEKADKWLDSRQHGFTLFEEEDEIEKNGKREVTYYRSVFGYADEHDWKRPELYVVTLAEQELRRKIKEEVEIEMQEEEKENKRKAEEEAKEKKRKAEEEKQKKLQEPKESRKRHYYDPESEGENSDWSDSDEEDGMMKAVKRMKLAEEEKNQCEVQEEEVKKMDEEQEKNQQDIEI